MELEVELEQVLKDIASDSADGFLGDACEDGVSDFLKDRGTDPSSSICMCMSATVEGVFRQDALQAKIVAPATVIAVPPTAAKSTFIESTMVLK